MSGKSTALSVDIDLQAPGKRIGHVRLPFSSHESAYGWLGLPVAVVCGGQGPDVLLTAGNHGDEYEGQIALLKLIRSLEPDQVHGRVIILPQLNAPAAGAGRRTSPLDEGNLNRSFPGDPEGGPTAQIAHFVNTVLLPMTSVSVDLHSGGSSLEYLPCVFAPVPQEPTLRARQLAALRAFGAPVSLMIEKPGSTRTLSAAAMAQGHLHLATELGGGATTRPTTQSIADGGVRRLLAHLGVIDDAPPVAPAPTRLMRVDGPSHYVYAPVRGLFEPAFSLGDAVARGDLAGCIHFPEEPGRPAREVRFDSDGVVVCRRVQTPVVTGDCLAHLACDIVD